LTVQLASARSELSAVTRDFAMRQQQFTEILAEREREIASQLATVKDDLLSATRALEARDRTYANSMVAREGEVGIQVMEVSRKAAVSEAEISFLKTQLVSLTDLARMREVLTNSLNTVIAERDAQVLRLDRDLSARNLRIARLSKRLGAMHRTISWRITAPLRRWAVWCGAADLHSGLTEGDHRGTGESSPGVNHGRSADSCELNFIETPTARARTVSQNRPPVAVAQNVAELLKHQAEAFVDCAYRTLLRRKPDTQGGQYYIARILSGSPKIQILMEISESEEARSVGVNLLGLAAAIKRYRLAQKPILRILFRVFTDVEIDCTAANRLRAIEQKLHLEGRIPDSRISLLVSSRNDTPLNTSEVNYPIKDAESDGAAENQHVPTMSAIVDRRGQNLAMADGIWEWSQYQVVKERIRYAKSSRRDLFAPKPIDLIEVGNESFASFAKRVVLPAPGTNPDVSIILPVFNNLQLTLECLSSISQHAERSVTFEVLVRDDASTDDTAQVVSAIKNVRLIRNPENIGFLRNCNRALESVRGQYVSFLNNDVQVSKGWLRTLLDTFSNYPKAGAVGPRFLYPSGHLQEAGVALRLDATAEMVGLNEDPDQIRFSYVRRVDYTSGACLMLPTELVKELGGFAEEYLPCYCEDSDLCLRVQEKGYYVYCNPAVTIVHHLSKTTAAIDEEFKYRCVAKNLNTLAHRWAHRLEKTTTPRVLAFYLPQFHPFPENNKWWGDGFTEWTNVTKAQANFEGHYQPRLPADLGYYDLRLWDVMVQQADLARSYGIDGFCFYYYWFGGKRLLDAPLEQMLASKRPDFPFCLCWANENWSRRWDGNEKEILIAQEHSPEDDIAAITDISRYFQDRRYIRIDDRPLILIYRVQLFPDFLGTAARWRAYCREHGLGEIYIAMVESFELVHSVTHPSTYGCDAAVEFPPQELAEPKPPSGPIVNLHFKGSVADYRDLAVKFATRDLPNYTRFMGVAPGWDNTARMQDESFCFENATPGAFQAWIEEVIEQTRAQHYGDERLIFINAWNEWAEGAYLEPDQRFGHGFLEAVRNAKQAAMLLRKDKYSLGG
jgi:O-antigen biosynthesis protein